MILNRQRRVAVNLVASRAFVQKLRNVLRLGPRHFNVCLVGDREIGRLNRAYRGKKAPTDVLSFPWREAGRAKRKTGADAEFAHFLGEVVISVETARRNARQEGHSTLNEIRWLILHGVLHLLGYDHETDRGEMTGLELALRERLGIEGRTARRPRKEER
jgi:probable rRNA maturation factor